MLIFPVALYFPDPCCPDDCCPGCCDSSTAEPAPGFAHTPVGDYLGMVAHELRQPLTILLGYTKHRPECTTKETLAFLHAQACVLQAITDGWLELAQPKSAQPYDPWAVADDVRCLQCAADLHAVRLSAATRVSLERNSVPLEPLPPFWQIPAATSDHDGQKTWACGRPQALRLLLWYALANARQHGSMISVTAIHACALRIENAYRAPARPTSDDAGDVSAKSPKPWRQQLMPNLSRLAGVVATSQRLEPQTASQESLGRFRLDIHWNSVLQS